MLRHHRTSARGLSDAAYKIIIPPVLHQYPTPQTHPSPYAYLRSFSKSMSGRRGGMECVRA
eukprot:6192121-Pleurochrysis_carterae.AAC.2